jgi:hypothetical protein
MVRGRVSRLQIPVIAIAVLLLLSMGVVFAQHQPSAGGQAKDMLMPGAYVAKVKAIVCDGCGPLIQKTLQNFKELEAVAVDQKNKTVQFSVKKGSMTAVSTLQKALDAAAKSMGMGADYSLSDIRPK